MTKLIVAETSNFDDDFYFSQQKNIASVKCVDYRKLEFQKESILAWSIVLDHCDAKDIYFDKNGKPLCNKCFFSISHSHGVVAVAFSGCNVGVDIEKIETEKSRSKLYPRVLTSSEISILQNSADENRLFYSLWTLKESYLKNTGEGLGGGLSNFDFSQFFEKIEFSAHGKYFIQTEIFGCAVALCTDEETELELETFAK